MIDGPIPEGLTFDDVLLLPGKSSMLPTQTDTRTCLSRKIALNIPIVASAMDTVTDARLAIAIARQGGIGFIHRNMTIDRQAEEVDHVKRSESGMIVDPVTIAPEISVRQALDIMNKYKVSGLPVTRGHAPRRHPHQSRPALRAQPRPTGQRGHDQRQPGHRSGGHHPRRGRENSAAPSHRKAARRGRDFNLKGLITVKDIQKKIEFPERDQGRARPLARWRGHRRDRRFPRARRGNGPRKSGRAGVDTAHGHSTRVMEAIRAVKQKYPEMQVVAGNVATEKARAI